MRSLVGSSPARLLLSCVLLGALALGGPRARAGDVPAPEDDRAAVPNDLTLPNASGQARTYSTLGALELGNPFFRSLGTNGRSCATCHGPADGWSITPATVQTRFEATGGADPIFRPSDGSTSPLADVSTPASRRNAYRLLLARGLIRVGLPVPAAAEFDLVAVDDPSGHASAAELSLFRRPLPSTNLKFATALMWDGRHTVAGQTMATNLAQQVETARQDHTHATEPLTAAQRAAIVRFETSLYTAQVWDNAAGDLGAAGADGGPNVLAGQEFFSGINTGPGAGPHVFTLYTAWNSATGAWATGRRAVARGETLFDTRVFGPFRGTCSTCHNAPNAGSNSRLLFVDLGLSDEGRRSPDLPLYTFRCRATGKVVRTTDPGRALVTGRCADFNRFKVPSLRGLAARAPYFHDGSAATIEEVVDFYARHFEIALTAGERADLVAFLRAL